MEEVKSGRSESDGRSESEKFSLASYLTCLSVGNQLVPPLLLRTFAVYPGRGDGRLRRLGSQRTGQLGLGGTPLFEEQRGRVFGLEDAPGAVQVVEGGSPAIPKCRRLSVWENVDLGENWEKEAKSHLHEFWATIMEALSISELLLPLRPSARATPFSIFLLSSMVSSPSSAPPR
jgi:hypothetical protein